MSEAPQRSSIEAQKRQGRGSEARPGRAGAGKIPPAVTGGYDKQARAGKKCYHTFIFINKYKKKITKSVMFLVSHKGKIDF